MTWQRLGDIEAQDTDGGGGDHHGAFGERTDAT
jgi:hypothetical protein